MLVRKLIIATGLTLGATAAYAADNVDAAKHKASELGQDLKTTTFDVLDKQSVTVDFDKGASGVTSGEKSDLQALVKSVQSEAKVDKVVVAAWPDEGGSAALAGQRLANVEKTLKTLGVKHLEGHNMATSPTALEKIFGKDDAKETWLKDKGGPGKAFVFVIRETDKAAH